MSKGAESGVKRWISGRLALGELEKQGVAAGGTEVPLGAIKMF